MGDSPEVWGGGGGIKSKKIKTEGISPSLQATKNQRKKLKPD